MSTRNTLIEPLEICCPHCGDTIDVWDLELAVTVDGHDEMLNTKTTTYITECETCDESITTKAHLSVEVSKTP